VIKYPRDPFHRLLAINLVIGIGAAVLMVGGLLALNPGGLRHLILADRTPATAGLLLLFGFVVTFGSVAMGTAIMSIGRDNHSGGRRRPVDVELVPAAATPSAPGESHRSR
jgi:hypothetical protein